MAISVRPARDTRPLHEICGQRASKEAVAAGGSREAARRQQGSSEQAAVSKKKAAATAANRQQLGSSSSDQLPAKQQEQQGVTECVGPCRLAQHEKAPREGHLKRKTPQKKAKTNRMWGLTSWTAPCLHFCGPVQQ